LVVLNKARDMRTMRLASVLALMASTLLPTASGQSRRVQCPSEPDVFGYDTIEAMNLDMEEISMNTSESTLYEFVLCPNTTFSVDAQPLKPSLVNCMFTCGESGSCVFDGGDEQVVLDESLFNVSFHGIDFQNFNQKSIVSIPSDTNISINSDVTFVDCTWRVSFIDHCILLVMLPFQHVYLTYLHTMCLFVELYKPVHH